MFESHFRNITILNSRELFSYTGCRNPCHYRHYSFIGHKKETAFDSDNYIFSLFAESDLTHIEREELVYPLSSLVAEFGGTLGLFLGFSFMAILDSLGNIFSWMKNRLSFVGA